MNLSVKFVDKETLPLYWPQCEPLLERGLDVGDGELNIKHIFDFIRNEEMYLVIGVNDQGVAHLAIAIGFISFPNYKIAHIYSIGGEGVLLNQRHWDSIKDWMRQQGASKVQGSCKLSQARLWQRLGLHTVYQLVRQDI